jgi:uncharacterized protein YndB with AHSA1/START domain
MTASADPKAPHRVVKILTVAAPVHIAFEVFTQGIGRWWPMASHHIGEAECQTVLIEPQVGGRWFERGVDGTECEWGRVLAWEPPHRVLLCWQLSAKFEFDPGLHTEVEAIFTALDANHTRLDFQHRGLDAYGPDALAMHGTFSSPNGWTGMLDAYAQAATKVS